MARESLSRGQGRLLVMAFEVAQVGYVMGCENVRPVLLIDDLSTELDIVSMQRFLTRIDSLGLQVFISSVLDAVVTLGPTVGELTRVSRGTGKGSARGVI